MSTNVLIGAQMRSRAQGAFSPSPASPGLMKRMAGLLKESTPSRFDPTPARAASPVSSFPTSRLTTLSLKKVISPCLNASPFTVTSPFRQPSTPAAMTAAMSRTLCAQQPSLCLRSIAANSPSCSGRHSSGLPGMQPASQASSPARGLVTPSAAAVLASQLAQTATSSEQLATPSSSTSAQMSPHQKIQTAAPLAVGAVAATGQGTSMSKAVSTTIRLKTPASTVSHGSSRSSSSRRTKRLSFELVCCQQTLLESCITCRAPCLVDRCPSQPSCCSQVSCCSRSWSWEQP